MAMAETLATRPLLDLADPRFLSDPYPFYRLLRERAPVWRSPLGMWVLSRQADIAAVLKDPRFGHEYFLRAESISVRLLWSSLLRGRIGLGTLSLTRPSLNLVRNSQDDWNISEWLPIPAGTNTPVGCRTCECSDNNYAGSPATLGCDGTTPWCETRAANVKHGDCVQCTTNAECSGANMLCEQSSTAAQKPSTPQ